MDFLNANTRLLSNKYQLIEFTPSDSKELMGVLYYFKGSGDFF